MNSLTDLRERGGKGIVLLLWVNLALIVARAVWGTDASVVVLVGGGVVVTLAATASWLSDRTGATTRTVTGLAHGVLVALLVYGFTGSSLQIDMHMYFFATLAICAAWVDWRPIASFSPLRPSTICCSTRCFPPPCSPERRPSRGSSSTR
ncbi:MAG TPA: hypothetical protein VGO17_15385 [Aurantimonas sp.]|nr:hypothetical protein [Aurantimonas sp.]